MTVLDGKESADGQPAANIFIICILALRTKLGNYVFDMTSSV